MSLGSYLKYEILLLTSKPCIPEEHCENIYARVGGFDQGHIINASLSCY